VYDVSEAVMTQVMWIVTPELVPTKDNIADACFTDYDIPNVVDRNYANALWNKYKQRIDLGSPTNNVIVKSLILLEIMIRNVERELYLAVSPQQIDDLRKIYEGLHEQYATAAENVAQLEKQFAKPSEESFDAVVKRAHDLRKDWVDGDPARLLEEAGLIKSMAAEHNVTLAEEEDKPAAQRRQERVKVVNPAGNKPVVNRGQDMPVIGGVDE
jgi:hypothetical protein